MGEDFFLFMQNDYDVCYR